MKKERIKYLIDLLNKASVAYYRDNISIMEDYEYDKLYDELVSLEKETGIVYSSSPTMNVEPDVSDELVKDNHEKPMLSLMKTKSIEDLEDFLQDKEGLLSFKLDGLTICLTYENGKLVKALTRGNGYIGEVVTNNAKQFNNILLNINYKGKLILRGEAVIKYSDFNKMNDEFDSEDLKYKNPRNLSSGSVRCLDASITKKRNVNLIIFSLVDCDKKFKTKEEEFKFLNELGFDTVQMYLVNKDNVKDRVLYYKEIVKNYDIPSDGLVLTFNDNEYSNSLNTTSKYPKHSIAFKWKDETKETILRDIYWSASRTGLINPVAIFDEVELEGTSVKKASLHNLSILSKLKLGIGDKILVYKANMIIPQVLDNLTKSDNIKYPDNCPVCNNKLSIITNNDISYLYCLNEYCDAKFIKRLMLLASRNAFNMDGLNESTLNKFVQEGLIKNLKDIFYLDKYKDIIINYNGFGEKTYNNIISSINKSRDIHLHNFIYALGINDIGLSRSKLICNYYDNDPYKLINLNIDDLIKIDGIGEIIAHNFYNHFNNPKFKEEYLSLLEEVNIIKNDTNNILLNKTFVITGTLNKYKSRDDLIKLIENNGGKVTNTISKNTSYLINNDINSTSSKNKKAKELGIDIISEEDFERLIF